LKTWSQSAVVFFWFRDFEIIFRRVLENWLQKWKYRGTSLENGLDAWSVLQQ
jgi:hypothetical protein